nr:MAG TPA: crystallin beta/gamma motif-containing protein [Caudoviricetes sp.]
MDLEKVRAGLQEIEDEKAAAQAEADKAANRSILDRVEDLGNEFMPFLGGWTSENAQQEKNFAEGMTEAAEGAVEGAVETTKDIVQAAHNVGQSWSDFRQRGVELQQAYSPENLAQANETGDYSQQEAAVANLKQAGEETTTDMRNLVASPFRQASRALINSYGDNTDDSLLSNAAQSLQRSDVNLEYFMTDDEKLSKAREIEASTGIPADAFLADNKAYKQALDVYHYKQKVDAAGGDINEVWKAFPELQGVADMDPEGAAIALHNLDAVRSTHGIIDTWQKMLERGNVKLEYDNLQYKILMGAADDNDRQRAEDLKKQLEEDRLAVPSFLEDPIAAIVGGVAESAPEMWQSTSESLREATAMAVIAAAASAAAGSVATPIGAAAGGTVGAAGGFVYGLGRGFLAQVARRELIAAAAGTGLRLGAFTGMARPEIGSRFAEYKELKDENGNPLLTENQAAGWAMLGGSLNAGIELANFGVVTRALAGAPHARKVFGDIIEQTGSRMLTREKVLNALKDRTGDVLKITASEAGEEGLQSISDDMVHNGMEWSTGDTSNKIYSPGEILERAGKSTLQAIPGSLGFGLLGATGGTVSSGFRQTAAMRHLAKFEVTYGENARKTYTGTVMLEQLQQAIDKGNLKEKAPDVQKKILREQLKNTEYPNTYIDSEMAMQQDGGLENLKAVAKAAGISNDELQTAIEEKGQILVPTEQFLQAGTSPEFLQNVSFSPEADSMARMQRDAKTIIEDMQKRQQQSIDKQVELINTVLDQYFPLHEKSSAEEQAMRDMAAVAIYSDPANPARGWSAAMKERQDRLQEIIGPVLERLRDGMGKGGQLMEVEDEQGNKKTQRFTENDEWYRAFYKAFKRQPTEKELEDMAVAVVTGDPSAPKLEGWIPTTEEEHQAMAAVKPEIDELRKDIEHLEAIKGTMKSLNGVEMELTQGLTKEGFQVYRAIRDQLTNVDIDGGRTARAARLDAILFARHADIVADIISKKTGKKYTALDYMRERYGLETEGNDENKTGFTQEQIAEAEKNLSIAEKEFSDGLEKWKKNKKSTAPIKVMQTPLVMQMVGAKNLPIYIDPSKLVIIRKTHPEMTLRVLKQIPRALTDPIMIVDSMTKAGRIVVVLEVRDEKGINVVIPFELDALKDRVRANIITSAYGKEYDGAVNYDWYLKNIRENRLLYVNRKKANRLLGPAGVQFSLGPKANGFFDSSIKTEEDLVKLKNENPMLYQMAWRGARYEQLAGQKAAVANLDELNRAREMHSQGADEQEIWRETGWLLGRDNKWRFEIPDNLDKIEFTPLFQNEYHIASLKDIYDNPRLYEAYPSLATRNVQLTDKLDDNTRGILETVRYPSGKVLVAGIKLNKKLVENTPDKIKETLVHEVQHAIQEYEDFARGGDLTNGLDNYYRLGGEQEARETAARAASYTGSKHRINELNQELDLKKRELEHVLADASEEEKADYEAYDKAYKDADNENAADGIMASIEKKNWKSIELWNDIYMLEWYIDDEKAIGSRIPKPHEYNAIITFGGQEMASIDVNQKAGRSGAHGSIAQMSNGQRIISLFESADESTFLHEMGHMFLMDLEDLAVIDDISAKELEIVKDWASWKKGDAKQYKNTPWEKEFRQREQQIIDAEEHQDIEEAEKLKRIWEQERFARAFEMYLHDGHAPAKGLRAVFRKFRSFLIHIYRAVIGDGAKPSLQVRRVMDRMIATEEEIDEMALDDRYRDVTKAGGEKLLDESEEETYKRWQEEATAEAKEQLQKRVMKDLTEEKEHEFQRRMQHERETFRKELQNENVYLAEQAVLASGGNTSIVLNWYPSVEAFEEELKNAPALEDLLKEHMDAYAQELDRELTESHLSEQAVTEAMESSEYRAKLEALKATAFAKKQALVKNITTKTERAMRSVEERIKDLPEDLDLKLDKDSSAVKELMKAINKLRFSAKWRPEDYQTIQRMIHAATKEDLQKTMQEIKERARTDKANEKAVLEANEGKMKVYRELARRAILTKPIHESCSVSLYTREAKKWAKTVQQAIRGKNWDSAMMAQQRQAYAMAMANEARQMQKRVQASLDKAKRMLQAKSVRLPREERYWLRHLAYLLRLTRTDAKLGEGEEMTDLHTMFNRLQESLDSQYTPEEIFKIEKQGEDFRGYQDLNVGQLEECVEALTILYTTGRDKFKMKTIGGRTVDEIVQEIISDNEADARKIGVNRHRVQEDTGGMGWNDALAKIPFIGEGLARYGQEGLAAIIKPEEILNALGKKAHRYIYGIYERAAEKESRMVKQELTDLQTILSGYSHSERRHWKDMKYTLRTADGKELMSKENVLCMALNLGNETNRQRLIGGLGISETDAMQFVKEHMTTKDWQLVQDIWDHINTYWDDTVKVEENLNGVRLEKVEAKPFDVTVTENGKKTTLKMKGGYYPLSYNPKKSSRAADQNANEIAKQGMSGAMVLGTGRGFTKARSEYDINRPLLLEFRVIPEHVQSVIHNIAFRLAARDVFRLVNHPDFEAHVATTLGREYHTILKQWTTDVWQVVKDNSNQAANMLERGLNWLRSNSVMAIMGYRIWPVVENVSNIAPVMEKLGSMHAMKAIMSFYANPKESTELLKRSAFMQDRINSLDRDIRSQPGLFEADYRVFELIRNHAYDLMLYSDLALSAPLWVQSYRDAYSGNLATVRRENAEHQQSVLKAQQDVEQLKADIISQSQKVSDIRMELERRHSTEEQDQAFARQSPFAVHSDAEMQEMSKTEAAKIQDIKKDLFKAEQALHDAMELPIYTDEEMLQEAERRSVMDADKAIRDTFGSGRIMDQSSLQRNKNAFLKLATTFYSFFNTQFNAILANYRHARFGTNPSFIGRWAPFAKSVMYRLVIMTLIGISIKFALGLDGDDDKDRFRTVINPQNGKSEKIEIPLGQRFFNTYAKNLLSTAAGGFPFIRDVVNFAISAIFDGTTYGRSASPFSVGGRAFEEVSKTIDLMAKKSSHNMAVDAQEAKRHQTEAEKLKKKKGKARQEYIKKLEENAKYRQPVKHITNSEIARHGLNALSSLTAARTGITSTMTDAITGTMQYLNDSDNRYDADWKNIIWSIVFDKKPVERDIPKRPPAEPKSKKKKKKS